MEIGPFAWLQITQMAASGLIRPEDMLRTDTETAWKPARECEGLFSPATAKPATAKPATAPPIAKAAKVIVPPPAPPQPPPFQVTPPVVAPPVQRGAVVAPVMPVVREAKLPTGIPVGTTLGTSPALPVGKPMSASPPLPRGTATKATSAEPVVKPPKKSNSAMLLLVGGGIAAVLVVVLVFAIKNANSPKPEVAASPDKTPATEKSTEKPVSVASAEEAAAALIASPKTVTNVSKPATKPITSRNPIVKEVKSWNSPTTPKVSLKGTSIGLKIDKIWLATDESGSEVPAAAAAVSGDETEAAGRPKFLFVRINVMCAAGNAPLTYQGWSSAAVVADLESGETIAALEPSATPELKRVSKTTITPGNSSEDVLVFPWSEASFEKWKLVLPHKNMGIKSNGAFGFHLVDKAAEGKTVAAKKPAAQPESIKEIYGTFFGKTEAGSGDPEMKKPTPGEGKPKSDVDEVDDLVKKLEREAKKAEMDEAAMKKRLAEEAAMKKE